MVESSVSKRVENTVGKGEIARYKQFLLFPQCFKRLVLQTRKNQVLFGKGLINLYNYVSPLHSLSPYSANILYELSCLIIQDFQNLTVTQPLIG